MPGIASDRSPGIQVGPITSIGTEVAPTPAIGDLMDAFKQGFITVDDLKRRAQQERLGNDAEKTQLQANDFQRRLAPGAFENAQAAQGLQAAQIQAAGQILPGATELQLAQIQAAGKTLPGATQLTLSGQEAAQQEADRNANRLSDDTSRQLAQKADDTKREYVQTFGHDPAKSIKIDAPLPALRFEGAEGWFAKEHGKEVQKQIDNFDPGVPEMKDRDAIILERVNQFVSDFETGSEEDNIARANFARAEEARIKNLPNPDALRAQYANQVEAQWMNRPDIRTEYENYKTAQAKNQEALKIGSEAHTTAMQLQIQDARDQAALRAAKLTAAPKIFEDQAKAGAGDAQAKEKVASGLRDEISKDKTMNTLGEENKFARRILDLTDPQTHPTPSNADALAALEAYIKLLDPNAVIRQGKLVVTQEMTPKLQQIGKLFNRISSTTGGFLSPEDITQLRGTTDTIIKATNREARQFLQVRANAATVANIPFAQVFSRDQQDILSGSSLTAAAPGSAVKPPPDGGPINRTRTSDGARFQWNGSTWIHQP